jgi:hypothetical protein
MKKILLIIISLLFATSVSATTAIYRISSGEVINISTEDDPFSPLGDRHGKLAVISNATYPDGTITRLGGELRVLGTAKILVGTVIRNATQQEIDGFAIAAADDLNQIEADKAVNLFQDDPRLRRILVAFAAVLVDEINILRSEHSLPDRTLQQLKTAILNRINKDD